MDPSSKPTIIALSGKGGVGKTSLAAAIVRLLAERFPDKRLLAVDADPAVGLSVALGVAPKATVDDLRREAIAASSEGPQAAVETLHNAEWEVEEALAKGKGFRFLAVGRPEAAGCYCKINSYLKEVIGRLADRFDYVVIDG